MIGHWKYTTKNGIIQLIEPMIKKMEKEMTMTKDIVAIAAKDCKTLAAAVKAAGLVETLQGKGIFILNYCSLVIGAKLCIKSG